MITKSAWLRPQTLMLTLALCVLSLVPVALAQDQPAAPSAAPTPAPGAVVPAVDQASPEFGLVADTALAAMKEKAGSLKIKGVALVAYVPGKDVNSWISKMVVVGNLTSHSSNTNDPGQNLLAIAYSKASEMADTLKPSGSKVRPARRGEFGYQGGWIEPAKNGWLIAAFSGGSSPQDLQVSKVGVAKLQAGGM